MRGLQDLKFGGPFPLVFDAFEPMLPACQDDSINEDFFLDKFFLDK